MSEIDPIPSLIENTLKAILSDDLDLAKEYMKTISEKELYLERDNLLANVKNKRKILENKPKHNSEKTKRPSHDSFKKKVFKRDNYTCCYCNRKTIDLDVLKIISNVIPDAFPLHSSWILEETHILYWIYSTSLEHVVPLAQGGKNDLSNMRVACYLCNDVKKDTMVEDLGWKLNSHVVSDRNSWQGLREYVPQLMELANNVYYQKKSPSFQASRNFKKTLISDFNIREASIGNFIRTYLPDKNSRRQYRVDNVSSDNVYITLSEMWREGSPQKWVATKNPVKVIADDLLKTELISEIAPSVQN